MKAVVHERYGGPEVLRIGDVPTPVPKEDEVLVRVRATTVTRTDCGFRQGEPFIVRFFTGLRRPKRPILGMEFAGEVAATGAAVTQFKVGDRVFGIAGHGAHAEYLATDAERLWLAPFLIRSANALISTTASLSRFVIPPLAAFGAPPAFALGAATAFLAGAVLAQIRVAPREPVPWSTSTSAGRWWAGACACPVSRIWHSCS